jgi:hypothetical protein
VVTGNVRVTGLDKVQAKLALAAPHMDGLNLLMLKDMLAFAKSETATNTPDGPAHFGYHGRDTLKVEVALTGATKVTGKLKGAAQMYWRERGTRGRFNKGSKLLRYTRAVSFGGGEKAYMTAHKALGQAKRLLKVYYGTAAWWHL